MGDTYNITYNNYAPAPSNSSSSTSSKASSQANGSDTGIAPAPSSNTDSVAFSNSLPIIGANEHARFWGDPHVVGGDGDKYDMQEPGIWNLLNDKGVNLNAKTARASQDDPDSPTYMKSAGLTVGDKNIQINADGSTTITNSDGTTQTLADGDNIRLDDSSYIVKNGEKIIVETPEYKMNFATNLKDGDKDGTEHLDVDVATKDCGVASDGQTPTGILGETFDEGSDKQTGLKNDTSDYARQSLFDGGNTQASNSSGSTSQSQSTNGTGSTSQSQSTDGSGSTNQSQSTDGTGSTNQSQSTDGTGSTNQSQSTDNSGSNSQSQSTGNTQTSTANVVQQLVQFLQGFVKLLMQMIQQLQGVTQQQ